MVDHKDGYPDHTTWRNLQWLCRSCNTAKGIWMRDHGKGRLTHQYNPAEGVPTYQQYAWAVSQHERGAHDEGGAIIHATPLKLRKEYASRIADTKRSRGRMADDERWNPQNPLFGPKFSARDTTPASGGGAYHSARRKPAVASGGKSKKKAESAGGSFSVPDAATLEAGFKKGLSLADMLKSNPARRPLGSIILYNGPSREQAMEYLKRAIATGGYVGLQMRGAGGYWKVTADSTRGNPAVIRKVGKLWRAYPNKQDANLRRNEIAAAVSKAKLQAHLKRKNPAAAAAEVFEEFHGFPSGEVVKVSKKVHRHEWLATAGELVGMSVRPVGHGLPVRHIGGLKGAILAFNELKNQLFVEGGDQFMSESELRKFGIRPPVHELETLGKLVAIDYATNKTHLGDEGGEAVYAHTLRTTNQDGRHVVVTIARYPDLIYRVLDQQFEFSGGSYEIRAEGIDK